MKTKVQTLDRFRAFNENSAYQSEVMNEIVSLSTGIGSIEEYGFESNFDAIQKENRVQFLERKLFELKTEALSI